MTKNTTPLEEFEQERVVGYLRSKNHPHSAIPNSTYTKSWAQKMKNQRQGLVAGLPDLFTIIYGNVVWIEMKRQKGGVTSAAQKKWHKTLRDAGQEVWVCAGADIAIGKIKELEKWSK